MFYEPLHGETALPLPYIPGRTNNNTRGHSDIFIQVPARSMAYANSFFNRTVKNQNGLSETVACAGAVDTLKNRFGRKIQMRCSALALIPILALFGFLPIIT